MFCVLNESRSFWSYKGIRVDSPMFFFSFLRLNLKICKGLGLCLARYQAIGWLVEFFVLIMEGIRNELQILGR